MKDSHSEINSQPETTKKTNIRSFQFANDDEWYTTKEDVEYFLEQAKIPKNGVIGCPFDLESSNFVTVLRNNGYKTIASHIDNGQDFYKYIPNEHFDLIMSNPPFRNKDKLIKRILDAFGSNTKFALIFGIQALNSERFCKHLQSFKRIQYIHLQRRMCFTKDHLNYDIKNLERPSFASMGICNDLFEKDIQVWYGVNYKNDQKEFC